MPENIKTRLTPTISPLPDSHLEIKNTLPANDFKRYYQRALKNLGEKNSFKGFRKGQVPQAVIERVLGSTAVLEVAAELAVNSTYRDLVSDGTITPLGPPEIKTAPPVFGQPFEFTLIIPALGPVKLPDYKNFTVKKEVVIVKPEDVKTIINQIINSRTKTAAVNRAAAINDLVEVDFVVKVNGVKIENGESLNHPVIIGEKTFMPGFEEQLVGLKAGESKDFELVAPKNYPHASLAGKRVNFSVKVNQVFERLQPTLNDEFASSLGNFKTVAHLNESIEAGLKLEREKEVLAKAQAELVKKISDQTTLEFPKKLAEDELEAMLSDLKNRLASTGMDWTTYLIKINKSEESLRDQWRPRAAERVKADLVISALIRAEKIEVPDAKINAKATQWLSHYRSPKAAAKEISPNVLYARAKHSLERIALLEKLSKQAILT